MTSPVNYHETGPNAQRDITDIDSIIEINGRKIVTTVETCRNLSLRGNARNNRRHRHRRRE